ncbi:DUF3693 domain-containing protein [Xylella fastidiosa subsp. multiplex]
MNGEVSPVSLVTTGNQRYHIKEIRCQQLLPPKRKKMDVKTLTELALKKSGDTSIRAFAKRLGVSHVTVLAWLDETRYPSFEHAAHLAGLAELPIIETASNIRMQCPSNTNKKRSILKQIANATATLLIGVGITHPNPSQAQSINKNFSNENSDNAYYVHLKRWVRELVNSLKKRPSDRLLATTW